jgi:L-gulono-1,4-lactone dehydrogenase
MPGGFLKKLFNGAKKILGIKSEVEGLFDTLKNKPDDVATAEKIKESFAKKPFDVALEILRRVEKKRDVTPLQRNWSETLRQTWHNTIKKEEVQPLQLISPTTKQELVDIVKDAEAKGLLVRAVGAGHSFSDVSNATDIQVNMLNMKAELAVETDTLKAGAETLYTAQSGMLVRDLNPLLDAKGLAIPTMAAFDFETIYGAIATSTHGTGLNVEGMPAMMRSLDLIAAGGRCYRVEPAKGITDPAKFNTKYADGSITLIQDDDKFYSTVVGFGLMGIVYSVTIAPVKSFFLLQTLWMTDWETVRAKLADRSFFKAINDKWEPIQPNPDGSIPPTRAQVFVNPYITKNLRTKKDGHTCVVQTQVAISQEQYQQLKEKEKGGGGIINKIVDLVKNVVENGDGPYHEAIAGQEDKKSVVEDISTDALLVLLNDFPLLTPLFLDISMTALLSGSRKFGKSYAVMNQGKLAVKNAGYSVEPGFKVNAANDFINGAEEVMRIAQLSQQYVSYITSPACMRFVKASHDYLSPEYESDTCMMDVPMMLGTIGDDQMYDRLQVHLIENCGARPHWGKICNLVNGGQLLKQMYPKFDAFRTTVKFFNPNGTFNSRFSMRTGITELIYGKP